MRLVDSMLMEIDQEAQTTRRSWISFRKTNSAGDLTQRNLPSIYGPAPTKIHLHSTYAANRWPLVCVLGILSPSGAYFKRWGSKR
jgi:hypothetical protein